MRVGDLEQFWISGMDWEETGELERRQEARVTVWEASTYPVSPCDCGKDP